MRRADPAIRKVKFYYKMYGGEQCYKGIELTLDDGTTYIRGQKGKYNSPNTAYHCNQIYNLVV